MAVAPGGNHEGEGCASRGAMKVKLTDGCAPRGTMKVKLTAGLGCRCNRARHERTEKFLLYWSHSDQGNLQGDFSRQGVVFTKSTGALLSGCVFFTHQKPHDQGQSGAGNWTDIGHSLLI